MYASSRDRRFDRVAARAACGSTSSVIGSRAMKRARPYSEDVIPETLEHLIGPLRCCQLPCLADPPGRPTGCARLHSCWRTRILTNPIAAAAHQPARTPPQLRIHAGQRDISEAGRRADAVRATEEAVALYRDQAAANPAYL